MSIVANVKVDDSAVEAVGNFFQLANWKKYIKKDGIVLKVNAVWDRIMPCCTTTPMVIDGVITQLKKAGFKDITIADGNTPAYMNAEKSFAVLGINNVAKKHNVKVINLSHGKFIPMKIKGKVVRDIRLSETLLNANHIITLPVMKTHGITKITGAIKNQWGCLPDIRHTFHVHVNTVLADINEFFKPKLTFAVMDAIFAMEGEGPKSGDPVVVGHVLASNDIVSLDSAAAEIMGFNPDEIEQIVSLENRGIGERNFKVVGDPLPKHNFKKAQQNLAITVEMKLRHTPFENFVFKTSFFEFLRVVTKIYYDIWFELKGRKHSREMMRTKYGRMWSSYLK